MFGNFISTLLLLFAVIGSFIGISASRKINELSQMVRSQRNRINRMQDQLDVLSREPDEPEKVPATEIENTISVAETETKPAAKEINVVKEDSAGEEFVQSAIPKQEPKVEPPPFIAKVDAPKSDSLPPLSDVPHEPSLQEKLIEKLNFPKGKPTEEIIFSYILPRLGVLGIGIAVFIVLAYFAGNSPIGKVSIGYSIAAALLGLGKWSESKQPRYAQVAYGGGLAVAYLVTFATYFLPFAKLFESPYPSLAGMAVLVGIWAWMAERKKSPVLGMVVTALGHFTIMLSVFSIEDSLNVSAFSVLILSAGSAYFLLRNRWYYVASVGLVFSYLNHALIMFNSPDTETILEFSLGIGILTGYYLIFSLAELFAPENLRRKSVPVWFRTAFVSVNTAMYLFLGSFIMEGFDFSTDKHHWFHYSLGAMLILIGTGYWKNRHHDPMLNAYFTKASGIVTLGLAYQFSGSALATSLAVEMLVLLGASRKSTLVVTRLLAYGVGVLALGVALDNAFSISNFSYESPEFTRTAIQFSLVTIAFWAGSFIYERTKWDDISPSFDSLSDDIRITLWRFDLASRSDEWPDSVKKHADGYLMPILYTFAGFVLANAQVVNVLEEGHRLMALGILGLGLLALGAVLRSMPLIVQSLGFLVTGFIAFIYLVNQGSLTWHSWAGVAALIPVALASEKNWFEKQPAFRIHTQPWTPFLVYPLLAIMIIGSGVDWADTDQTAYAIVLIGAAVIGALSFGLHPLALCVSGTLIYAFGWTAWNFDYVTVNLINQGAYPDSYLMYTAVGLMALGFVGDRVSRAQGGKWLGIFLQCAVMAVALRFVVAQFPEAYRDWASVARTGIVLIFLGYSRMFRTQTAAVLAILALAYNSFFLVAKSLRVEMDVSPLLIGFMLLIAMWIVFERISAILTSESTESARKQVSAVLVAIVTALSLFMFTRFDFILDNYLTISWALLSVALFFGAVVTRVSPYRYAGLVVLAISIGRVVFVDTTDLEAIPKAMAYGGLGVVCLGLGWLYIRIFGFSSSDKPEDDSTEEISTENEIE
jgi:uncharacterized coiled-coil protein SlyX